MRRPELIGVAGTNAAGKDTAADILVHDYDFYHVSTSDIIRSEAMKRYGNTDRETLRFAGNEMRQQFGADILCILAIEQASQEAPHSSAVISGIRAIGEATAIKTHGGVVAFFDAPVELRFQRLLARGRLGDDATLEAFIASEALETSNVDVNAQNISAVRAMSDIEIINDGKLSTLRQAIYHDIFDSLE